MLQASFDAWDAAAQRAPLLGGYAMDR